MPEEVTRKGKVIEAHYFRDKDPESILFGFFAINCEELPGFIDEQIVWYFDSEEDFEDAKRNPVNGIFILEE